MKRTARRGPMRARVEHAAHVALGTAVLIVSAWLLHQVLGLPHG